MSYLKSPKPKDIQFTMMVDKEKACLEKRLTLLRDHQNSWPLLFYQLIK